MIFCRYLIFFISGKLELDILQENEDIIHLFIWLIVKYSASI